MSRRSLFSTAFLSLMLGLLVGCSQPTTGPVEVKWDRDACHRCRMVLSDRQHAAEVRVNREGRSKVYKFDDVGCAVLWLEKQSWKDTAKTEIWVTDYRDGHWIDARKAYYVPGQITPMEYGLGARDTPVDGGLTFEQAVTHIHKVEAKFNVHNAPLEETAKERNAEGDEAPSH
jgi:copper chaperone NosL